MTKSELLAALAAKHPDLGEEKIIEMTNHVLEHIADRLYSGDSLEIRGFGTIKPKIRPARHKHNPRTREGVEVEESVSLTYKPSRLIKEALN